MIFPFAIIAASIKKLKHKHTRLVSDNKQNSDKHQIYTVSKEQFYKWQNEGKCGCCGAPSGEYVGICDECRYS